MQSDKRMPRFTAIEYGLILLCFCVCLTGAMLLPTDQCPDEEPRRFLSDWIVRTGTLPTGDELPVMIMHWEDAGAPVLSVKPGQKADGWGFSYALRSYLSSIIGALFEKAASFVTGSRRILRAASRMCSVLAVTACCFFCLRLGHRLFESRSAAVLFAAMVTFLPQVMFLGMYQNNDALSLCAVSMMLTYLAEGHGRGWPAGSCAGLAVSFSLGLLSYYPVYGWLLTGAVFCVLSVLKDPQIRNKGRLILGRTALIAGICLLLAGWFFLRNALLHDGDFLGLASEQRARERMSALGYTLHEYVSRRNEGMSIPDFLRMRHAWWLRMSARSFVGVFGYMVHLLPRPLYRLYYAVFAGGTAAYIHVIVRSDGRRPGRRETRLMPLMLTASAITLMLHFWQSYARDFQPQGRYVITLIIPLAYMTARGLSGPAGTDGRAKGGWRAALNPAAVLTGAWLLMFAGAAGTMAKMLR